MDEKLKFNMFGRPELTPERLEHWRREMAEAVAGAAKHGAPEHIDNRLNDLVREVYEYLHA